jgi:DNA-binding IclR family transcriptional regulator
MSVDLQPCVGHCAGGKRSAAWIICDELGWTRSTLRDVLDTMVSEGVVRRTKASPRDPGQKYTLVEE